MLIHSLYQYAGHRFEDDLKFIDKHKEISTRQAVLWEARYQELSRVFNIPIGDKKLHDVSFSDYFI